MTGRRESTTDYDLSIEVRDNRTGDVIAWAQMTEPGRWVVRHRDGRAAVLADRWAAGISVMQMAYDPAPVNAPETRSRTGADAPTPDLDGASGGGELTATQPAPPAAAVAAGARVHLPGYADQTATVMEVLAQCPDCWRPAVRVRRDPGCFPTWGDDEGVWHADQAVPARAGGVR
jgi:hypothetical protein